MRHSETCRACNPISKPVHDCAQVERDCLDLHNALAQALRRQAQLVSVASKLGGLLDGYAWPSVGRGADMRRAIEDLRTALHSSPDSAGLFAMLERTSRPDPKITDLRSGGFAT